MRPFFIDSLAKAEIRTAKEFYEELDPRNMERIEEDLNQTPMRIRQNPLLYAIVFRDMRQAPLSRFPYSLVYYESTEGIQIIAFIHHRRKPGYWIKRLP